MPWKGVTVCEQRQRFLHEYRLNHYPGSELAERFGISRKTAHKWIERYEEYGQNAYQENSRRPHRCPWQTDAAIVEELVSLRNAHPPLGPSQATGSDASPPPEVAAPGGIDGGSDPGRAGASSLQAPLSTGSPGVSPEHPAGPQRHLGSRLQGAVPTQERAVLLPAHGQ